jgi:hypothetical protein
MTGVAWVVGWRQKPQLFITPVLGYNSLGFPGERLMWFVGHHTTLTPTLLMPRNQARNSGY